MASDSSTAPLVSPKMTVSPSPHVSLQHFTTRRMMIDVAIGLSPAVLVSVLMFQWHAAIQIGICVASCVGFEALFTRIRCRPLSIGDGSAAITGLILALSLPWGAPWYAGFIASGVAIGLAKVCFGGLGGNIFNPAMAGRAFVILSFAKQLGGQAYVMETSSIATPAGCCCSISIMSEATPLTAAKDLVQNAAAGQWPEQLELLRLFVGNVNGSLGETSAIALLIGGIYLCVRRSAAWEIPAGVLLATFLGAGVANWLGLTPLTALHHLLGGSLIFGAFFIATDPVTSPLAFRGRFLFGVGVGAVTMLLRIFSSYPEGVMFAVLLMNALVPLINRVTIPRPLGGRPEPIEI